LNKIFVEEMATEAEILASAKPGKPPADCPVIGTWSLQSYVRERLSGHNRAGRLYQLRV